MKCVFVNSIIGVLFAILFSCTNKDPLVTLLCLPGDERSCPCPNSNQKGRQYCSDDGHRWESCQGCSVIKDSAIPDKKMDASIPTKNKDALIPDSKNIAKTIHFIGNMTREVNVTSDGIFKPVSCIIKGPIDLKFHPDGTINGTSYTYAQITWKENGEKDKCFKDPMNKYTWIGSHSKGSFTLGQKGKTGSLKGTYTKSSASGSGKISFTTTGTVGNKVKFDDNFSFTASGEPPPLILDGWM